MVKLSVLETASSQRKVDMEPLDENIVEKLSHRSKKNGLSENSKATYRYIIRDLNRFLAENGYSLSPESLKRYFDSIADKYRVATLNLRKYALMKILKAQFGENDIFKNMAIEKCFEVIPTYQTDQAVPYDECLSEEDIQAIINTVQHEKVKLIIQILFKTGCRVSEMINIRLCDLRSVNGYLKIQLRGKGNKAREVVIPRALYEAIRKEFCGIIWLFESRTGNRLDRSNIFVQIQTAGENAGFPDLSPHMLRHARATDMLLNKNLSLKVVSKYLGHSSTSTTADMYIHDEFDAHALFDRDRI